MTGRRAAAAAVAVAVMGAAVAAYLLRGRLVGPPSGPFPTPGPELETLRREHEALHRRLDEALQADALVQDVERHPADAIVAVRSRFATSLVREVAKRYLDRVVVRLEDVLVDEDGDMKKKTPFGRFKVGEWTMTLTIHRLEGTIRAGEPKVDLELPNRVRVVLPARIQEGSGEATLAFTWDSKALTNLVCRDFEVVRPIDGRVLPEEYTVSGAFVLDAAAGRLVARPEFSNRRFRLHLDLSDRSWAELRQALEEQDSFAKCGVPLDPEDVMHRLRELTRRGFEVTLPRKLFRPVDLPAGFRESVTVEGRPVELTLVSHDLRMTPELVWFTAGVQSKVTPAPSGGP